ncbi:hypothetical protein [Streptomyces sp. NPDC088725]|uniref:hypothetical protein n=1 Tax=Streptomyces sp. NPDC088725 TaxID=3365873 RepID=UPI003824B993
MTSASGTPHSVEATTALLREELPHLEEHQQSLEKELAVVTDRLESVRTALNALQALSLAPLAADRAPAPAGPPAAVETGPGTVAGTPKKAATKKAAQKRIPAKKTANPKRAKSEAPKKAKPSAGDQDEQAGGLTEQVLAVLSGAGKDAVRARDVARALGRDATPGSINAVRSTLDRLVATSRADRAGRGLYRARA